MNVGIVGLGLIGGSLARAYSKAGHTVLAYDQNDQILSFAQLATVVTGPLHDDNIQHCNLILLAIYTEGSVRWLESNAHRVRQNAIVIDCCGVKQKICRIGFALADQYGFTFIGGHPMAGSHNSGFKYSRSNLFQGAPMVLVPPKFDDPLLFQKAVDALAPCGFGSFSITTAEKHDEMIAFTSQMPHIISNAFIKSPTALAHKGFSAGSYKDLTRVAWLNSQMWAELFLSNQDNVLNELNTYIACLQQYRDAIEAGDEQMLIGLLEDGKLRKEEIDG